MLRRNEQESIIAKAALNVSITTQTPVQIIEKGIDNYTRLLEQDKRRFFRIQQHRNQTLKLQQKRQHELDALKSKEFKTETTKKKGEIKILERQLEQAINSYNEIVASNKTLKFDIDELRKQKLNHNEAIPKLTAKIAQTQHLISLKKQQIQTRKKNIQNSKKQIIKLKADNQAENKGFRQEINIARSGLHISNARSMMKHHHVGQAKAQIVDIHPLVKFRLRHTISSNKEKIKIIEYYEKTMQSIYKTFQYIKEQTGIEDMEDITSMFLKNEEQDHTMYTIISKLNKEIEDHQEQMTFLAKKIQLQKDNNKQYLQELGPTPQKEDRKRLKLKIQANSVNKIKRLEEFLKQGESILSQVGISCQLGVINATSEFSKLEEMIIKHFPRDEINTNYHEEATKYTKPPTGCEDMLNNREEKLMDHERLREFAQDYWEKRKNTTQR